ncbi:MAG TPA: SurA N-terminal domain-containing protein [bacterium]|nr:SurA N-terminal domain-containing protein [bacterium]
MMRTLRDKRTMHIVLWGLVAAFVSSIFFVFGMKFTNGGKLDSGVYAAKVGEDGVPLVEYNKACQNALDRFYSIREEGPTPAETKEVRKEVLDSMIDDLLMRQAAQKLGISVSDEELSGVIRNQSYFMKNGVFDKETYFDVLRTHQMTPEDFEASEKRQMLIQKMRSILSDSMFVGTEEAGHFNELSQRDLKALYIALDEPSFEKGFSPSEMDLKDYYQRIRTQFDHPDRVKIRHLYLTTQGGSPLEGEKFQKDLMGYREQILSGKAKFADLVKKYSNDERTKADGGNLGWVDRGMLKDNPEFEEGIFKLKKGEISKPLKLGNGYDLVQALDTEKAYKSTFAEVKEKVLERYKQEKGSQKLYSISTELADDLRNGIGLKKAASDLGLSCLETGWFNAHSGIPGLKDSQDTALDLATLFQGNWKGPLSIGKKQYFFQVAETRPAERAVSLTDQQKQEFQQRIYGRMQDNWLKEFLKRQRAKVDVKTYVNG